MAALARREAGERQMALEESEREKMKQMEREAFERTQRAAAGSGTAPKAARTAGALAAAITRKT